MAGYQKLGNPASSSFEQINANISSNIYKLKQNINKLTQQSKLLGTPKDSNQIKDSILETFEESNKLASQTTEFFKFLSNKSMSKDESMIFERAKRTSTNEINTYRQLVKDIHEKMKLAPNIQSESKSNLIDFGENEYNQRQQQLQRQRQLDLEGKLENVREREQRITRLETDINELNTTMKEISVLVYDQGSIIDNISTNVESAYSNVESGNDQLQQASKYAAKYRKKVLILVLVALVVLLIIGLTIWLSIRNK